MIHFRSLIFVAVLAAVCLVPATALAEAPARALAGPTVRVYSAAPTYRVQMRRTFTQLRKITGLHFVLVPNAASSDVQVSMDRSLHCLGKAGEAAAGQWLHLAPGCTAAARTIIFAHEFGHVMGLHHVKGCSVMNDTFRVRGARAWPILCRPGVITPTHSYTASDARTLRSLYINQPPHAAFSLDEAAIDAGDSPYLTDDSSDPDSNLASMRIDWGQGSPFTYAPGIFEYAPPEMIEDATPVYDQPGTYTITMTVTDSYGAVDQYVTTLTVNAAAASDDSGFDE